jgi:D-proline reductase (dithiol) PrdB
MMFDRILRDQSWIVNTDIPWKHLGKDLSETKVALITTAGVYPWKATKHFNLADDNGDGSFREIRRGVSQEELRVSHKWVDLKDSAALDFNCIFPLDRLAEMERDKRISTMAEVHYSVMGEVKSCSELVEETVPKIVKQLQKFLVDLVILSPVGPLGHQTAGQMARAIEDEEISTVMVGCLRSICENVKPPRTVLVRFPFGQLFGAAFDHATQREVLNECLIHAKSIREPGEIAELGLRWRDSFTNALQARPDLVRMMRDASQAGEPTEKKKIAADAF